MLSYRWPPWTKRAQASWPVSTASARLAGGAFPPCHSWECSKGRGHSWVPFPGILPLIPSVIRRGRQVAIISLCCNHLNGPQTLWGGQRRIDISYPSSQGRNEGMPPSSDQELPNLHVFLRTWLLLRTRHHHLSAASPQQLKSSSCTIWVALNTCPFCNHQERTTKCHHALWWLHK